MRFAVKDHLEEAAPMIDALLAAGHELSADGPTDLFLVDLDPDKFGYRELIDFYREQGAVVLQYPHGAPLSTLHYDCLYEPYKGVDGQLTNGQGEIDYLRILGIDRPAQIMGWQLCRQLPFRGDGVVKRVTFAPTHVNADGSLDRERMVANREIFRALLAGPWELVVRYIGELDMCGLWKDDRVFRYVEAERDMTTVEIDGADVVVAGAGTYPCLAIARGCPTIMYGQFDAARYGLPDEKPKPLRNLSRYKDLVRYPIDVQDGPLEDLIFAASAVSAPMRDWKQTWIGDPFVPEDFVQMVEAWVPELRDARARRLVPSVG